MKTTARERKVVVRLAAAWNAFLELQGAEPGHPDDLAEFRLGIHLCQMVVSHRLAARTDPETWSSAPADPLSQIDAGPITVDPS